LAAAKRSLTIGVLEEIKLGSINKEGLLKNKSPKGDLRGVTTILLRVISTLSRNKSFFYLLLFYKDPI